MVYTVLLKGDASTARNQVVHFYRAQCTWLVVHWKRIKSPKSVKWPNSLSSQEPLV